jgi:hypothetical protein
VSVATHALFAGKVQRKVRNAVADLSLMAPFTLSAAARSALRGYGEQKRNKRRRITTTNMLLASGYWIVFMRLGGFAGAGLHIHLMQMIGWLMIALFVWLFHGPWLSSKRVVDSEDWPRGVEQSQPRELGLPVQEKSGIRGLSATPMW